MSWVSWINRPQTPSTILAKIILQFTILFCNFPRHQKSFRPTGAPTNFCRNREILQKFAKIAILQKLLQIVRYKIVLYKCNKILQNCNFLCKMLAKTFANYCFLHFILQTVRNLQNFLQKPFAKLQNFSALFSVFPSFTMVNCRFRTS